MDDDFLNRIAPDRKVTQRGIYAVCSAHPAVLSAAMRTASADQTCLLVETTPNQVNQFGGYSGLTPAAFRRMVEDLALKCGFAREKIILGADHLGPYVWRKEKATVAMQRALDLTREFVFAGFRKLHLDAGMALGDDLGSHLDHAVVAERALQMMTTAEAAHAEGPSDKALIAYVIGAEAPTPGGGLDENFAPVITSPEEIACFLDHCQSRLNAMQRADLIQRIIAVVAQPGVDFGDRRVVAYAPEKAAPLAAFVKKLPPHMTCEVHATDYQTPEALAALIDDGFRILKVGPCLTRAFCRAVFHLADIEEKLSALKKSSRQSNLRDIIEKVMIAHPEHWQSHYHGDPAEQAWLRRHSLRDRIRYYWNYPEVDQALAQMLRNLSHGIPAELLLRHWPDAPSLDTETRPETLIIHCIERQLRPYALACGGA